MTDNKRHLWSISSSKTQEHPVPKNNPIPNNTRMWIQWGLCIFSACHEIAQFRGINIPGALNYHNSETGISRGRTTNLEVAACCIYILAPLHCDCSA